MHHHATRVGVLCVLLIASCSGASRRLNTDAVAVDLPPAAILVGRGDATVYYAVEELRAFLKGTMDVAVSDAALPPSTSAWAFHLDVDTDMEAGTFAVSCEKLRSGHFRVKLSGADSACVLHAVYTMLERAGVCFDVLGPVLPERLDLDRLIGWHVSVRPAVRQRGIRQHINFPMDISSYPLPEAKEYIRNLARLRFNHITFHSYHGQWHRYKRSNGKEVLAGNFFYGQRHDLPDDALFRDVVRNRKTYCIPELEPYYDQPGERSRRAIEWLQEVMKQAKTAGMTLQFSIEAPHNLDDGLAACRAVLQTYPLVDTLELITGESFGPGDKLPVARQRERIEKLFGPQVAREPGVVASLVEGRAPQWGPVQSFANNLKVAKALKEELTAPGGPGLALGAYVTDHQTLKVIVALMRRLAPPDVRLTFIPSHGARAAVEAIRTVKLTAEDWRRTIIYTWLEFDGNMYLQQNVVEGTRQMLQLGRAALGEEPLTGLVFSHWRTAENRTATRYAALACIEGPLEPDAFYKDYARSLKLRNPETYAAAMAALDDVDNRARDELFNIGFCFRWCWMHPPGLGWTRGWEMENLQAVLEGYRSVRERLRECRPGGTANAGAQYLSFLDNRLECTDLHLQAIRHLLALHPLVDDKAPETNDPETQRRVLEHTGAAERLARRYMERHARAIADRGCEGTLISYSVTIPPYIERARETFTQSER